MDSNHRPHAYQACALTRLSYRPLWFIRAAASAFGGPDRVRTDDLLDANQALSQLSYGPNWRIWRHVQCCCTHAHFPRTSGSSGRLGEPDKFRSLAGPANGNVDLWPLRRAALLRKEVIQPQVLLQLPCYDFTPITKFTIET